MNEEKLGYRWYIRIPAYGEYEPNEMTFDIYEEALADGIECGYSLDEIGIDYCKEVRGFVTILEKVKNPKILEKPLDN